MCGIYGMVSLSGAPLRHGELLERMGAVLQHRGPDGTGTRRCDHAAVGAERLGIVDLRPQAAQPFCGTGTTSWLVCNGEIYNAATIRARFPRYPFRSHCDVEALLPLLEQDGEAGLDAVEGMFGLAFWRDAERSLILARDRAGEKPLFYAELAGELWFASEIQALLLHPAMTRQLDELGLSEYLALGYVREPRTMFRHVRKVPAGVSLTFRSGHPAASRAIALPRTSVSASVDGARGQLGGLLEDAVAKQLTADVPVGVFLSGGVDSALIAHHAVRVAGLGIHTFTASFTAPGYDEGAHARRVSQLLGTTHVETRIGEAELTTALQAVMKGIAEPLADPALLPSYLLAREAKQHVGVVLSGEGADELFGGYPTYLGHRAARMLGPLGPRWHRAIQGITAKWAATPRPVALAFMVHRLAEHAGADWLDRHLAWFGTGLLPYLHPRVVSAVREALPELHRVDLVGRAMELDYLTYLRDGLLVKLDRAAMLASLENRSPFLDPHVRGFAADLPEEFLIRGWRTKHLLKEVTRTVLPAWIVRRRKRGLSVPVASLLNGALRQDVDRRLNCDRLRDQGVLPDLPIDQLLSEHRTGRANHARPLWSLLVLQHWLEQWGTE